MQKNRWISAINRVRSQRSFFSFLRSTAARVRGPSEPTLPHPVLKAEGPDLPFSVQWLSSKRSWELRANRAREMVVVYSPCTCRKRARHNRGRNSSPGSGGCSFAIWF